MSQAQTILYRFSKSPPQGPAPGSVDPNYRFIKWTPSISYLVPPGKGKKYFAYWLFHYLRLFRNRDYSAVLMYDGELLVSSLLVVPAYYKWPFMKKDDVQLTYVLTHPDYRAKGLAEQAVRLAMEKNQRKGRAIWYVTNSENAASIRLCEKVGFEFAGYGEKRRCCLRMVG